MLSSVRRKIRIIELPIGVRNDGFVGSINVQRTLRDGGLTSNPS